MKTDSQLFNIIRWLAPSFVFVAIWFHAFDIYPLGPIFHLAGAILWVYVGVKTKQGPVLLNFIPQIPIWSLGLIYYILDR